jgi:hypothetical protein
VPAAAAALVFLAFATLYITGQRAISDHIMFALGVNPWTTPFLDADG